MEHRLRTALRNTPKQVRRLLYAMQWRLQYLDLSDDNAALESDAYAFSLR
jgi:hypothetical protein